MRLPLRGFLAPHKEVPPRYIRAGGQSVLSLPRWCASCWCSWCSRWLRGRARPRCSAGASWPARLRQLGAPESQLAAWVCIAHRESGYNTAALNTNTNKSKDFGIFQINNRFWCDRGTKGCRVSCSSLQDNDVADDFRCAQQIYRESKRISSNKGDGFNAWYAYRSHCTNGRAATYLDGC